VKWNGHYRRFHCANLPLPNAGFGNSAQYQTLPEEVIKHRYFDKQKDFLSNSPFVFLSEKQRWVKWLVGFVYVFIDGGKNDLSKLGLQWRKPEKDTVNEK